MKRTLLLCLAVLFVEAGFTQSFYPEEPMYVRPSKRAYMQEITLRYEFQPVVKYKNNVGGPTLQHIVVDYGCYNASDLGFRTGLKVGITPHTSTSFAIPLHFSFRSGRIDPLYKSSSPSVDFHNGKYHVCESDRVYYSTVDSFGEAVGVAAAQTAASLLPLIFEVHAGLTPGLFTGSSVGSEMGSMIHYLLRNRFLCTADFGIRFIIPFWRMGIVADGTLNYLITNNYRSVDNQSVSRLLVSGTIGLVYRF